MDSFAADYHETEEGSILVYELGRISLEWNMVEQFFSAAIWEMLGDYPAGMAITAGMGNLSKADVVLRLSKERLKDKDTLEAIEFACKALNVLRDNRNVLMHSHSIFPGENGSKPQWVRASGKDPTGHKATEADLKDLEELISQICGLGKFVVELVPFLHRKRRKNWPEGQQPSLPAAFPLPKLLKRITDRAGRGSIKKPSHKNSGKIKAESSKEKSKPLKRTKSSVGQVRR
jgi:hypothetical protein